MTEQARYPFVAVDVAAEVSDELAAALFELGATGVEERDGTTLVRGAPGRVTLVGSFDTREEADAAIEALNDLAPDGGARLEEVIGDAWRDAWKEHFAPFALTPRITVVPPWCARPETAEMVLELEPGRAFGTGLHATTSLIAEILDGARDALVGKEILDLGTGSGILSLVALRYGALRALAVDIDPDVIEVVRENAGRNGLADRVEARAGTVESITRAFPWVLANIEARVLGPIAPDVARVTAPGGTLVLSGILKTEHDAMVTRYTALPEKLVHVDSLHRRDDTPDATEWVAIVLRKAS